MSTPEDQALEVVKEAVKNLLAPVTDVMNKLFGPAATEIGLSWGEAFRVWRLKRTVRLLEEVKQIASDAGLDLKPVAPRLLFPILEAASLEDDEDLRQRWVALLTNAARTDFDNEVLPAFPDILKQLTSQEAKFLDEACDQVTDDERRAIRERHRTLSSRHRRASKGEEKFPQLDPINFPIRANILKSAHPIFIENLERLMLVTRNSVVLSSDETLVNTFPSGNRLYVTQFGRAFVRACRVSKNTVDTKG